VTSLALQWNQCSAWHPHLKCSTDICDTKSENIARAADLQASTSQMQICVSLCVQTAEHFCVFNLCILVTLTTRSALGRAHVPPTKVFRRLSRHSRVDYSNAVFAVSRRYITDISMKIKNAQQVFCWPRRLLSVSMYFGTHLHRKLPFVSKRGSN